jgi:hypothetical protein
MLADRLVVSLAETLAPLKAEMLHYVGIAILTVAKTSLLASMTWAWFRGQQLVAAFDGSA